MLNTRPYTVAKRAECVALHRIMDMKKGENMRKTLAILLALMLMLPLVAGAQDKEAVWLPYDAQGQIKRTDRDATGSNGVVSAANYYASKVGVDIIQAGGNAIDAAVAVAFAMSTVESYYSGLGGGGFMTVRFAETGETVFIDFRELAPMAATPDTWPKDAEGKYVGYYQMISGPSIGVPGQVRGLLYALETYGTMSREQVIAPAVKLANEGFEVGAFMNEVLTDSYALYTHTDETRKIYYREDGLPYEVGEIYTNKELGSTLQKIIDEGESAFYSGPVAEAIVNTAAKYGCQMTLEDLANYQVKVRDCAVGNYRGFEIISSPPSSSGGTIVVEILNILENFDVAAMEVNSPEYIHLFSEAFKIAFADRSKYMADTDFADVPLQGLTDKAYAKAQSEQIKMDKAQNYEAGNPYNYQSSNTTHFSIMDKAGNMVAVTQTNNGGSGIVAEGTGVLLNNEMADFATGSESVNAIQGGKRPLSSMSPTLILNADGTPFATVGTPGGTRIITTIAQVISHLIDHNMDIQEAIDTPRFFNTSGKLSMETRIPEEVSEKLAAMGHEINRTKDWDIYYGGVHGVVAVDKDTLRGGADPRRDGKALGY